MIIYATILIALIVNVHCIIRGIMKSEIPIYSQNSFICRDNSATIPSSYINDNFCDCKDGSDEPGTSACDYHFYCLNHGYKGKMITSSSVNDGICDCCDGSDEYETKVCVNECYALAEKERELLRKKKQELLNSMAQKDEYKLSGESLRKESIERALYLQEQYDACEKSLEELNVIKVEKETKEREENDTLYNDFLEKDKKTENILRDLSILHYTIDDFRALFHHIAKTTDSYRTLYDEMYRYKGEEIPPNEVSFDDQSMEYFIQSFPISLWTIDDMQQFLVYYLTTINNVSGVVKQFINPQNDITDMDFSIYDYHYHNQEAQDARANYDNKYESCHNLQKELNSTNLLLDPILTDYELGMYNICIEGQFGYKYELCFFNQVTQDQTSLGKYQRYDRDSFTIFFAGGLPCWNNSPRESEVTLQCGPINKILEASEPSTCHYRLVAETPLVCDTTDLQKFEFDEPIYDEL